MKKNSWKPSASIENLKKRADILQKIRFFFKKRGIMEVETPAMSNFSVTDVHISSFKTQFWNPGEEDKKITFYLMTSPEFHMKRLLAAGSGPIFQLFRSFRNEECGSYHNPEFTMLEWYRPYYDMYSLMNEVNDLLQNIIANEKAEAFSYQEVFKFYIGVDPLSVDNNKLYDIVFNKMHFYEREINLLNDKRDTLLQLLFSMEVEPNIGLKNPVFIYHFPASQAGLAKINIKDNRISDRFELFYQGIELANGFFELTDFNEQKKRFLEDNDKRKAMNLPQQPLDENFLSAIKKGIPECSGVAMGIDRLVMIALQKEDINEVIAFPFIRS